MVEDAFMKGLAYSGVDFRIQLWGLMWRCSGPELLILGDGVETVVEYFVGG